MFYGSGAGKLPTASAVVGDMVEMAKHKDENIYLEWKPEKLELADAGKQENRFFVRTTASVSDVESVFGEVELVDAGVEGEIGFVTGIMEENAYSAKAEKLGNVLQMIRMG